VVTVPVSAVIDSGTRQIVLIQKGEGRFEPREVKLGARSDTDVEVIEGVKDGEQVVVAANFLIDAESNLKAAIGGFSSAPPAAPAKAEMPAQRDEGGHTQGRRPPGRRHRRQRGREGGHDQPQSRPGAQPEMAGHDHGIQGGQRVAAARAQAGCEGRFRVH
jgi:hypothetical protein